MFHNSRNFTGLPDYGFVQVFDECANNMYPLQYIYANRMALVGLRVQKTCPNVRRAEKLIEENFLVCTGTIHTHMSCRIPIYTYISIYKVSSNDWFACPVLYVLCFSLFVKK